ncbi:hypothetical protein LSH36_179g02028 [Paralvinella palmiformis]|uniref:Uncharacterized protein n=1 Tax=Paralvinella palmiformis TaxID=53620 RepID=A0AAD9JSA1_9ANNE|nr:hypothetical protein LSH36_179g02028 [Paralvinella palmiformis]
MVVKDIQGIMETDGSNSSRPLLIPITSPDEANAAFDGITYDKLLLNNFEYKSIVTQDLWDSMQQVIGGRHKTPTVGRLKSPLPIQYG